MLDKSTIDSAVKEVGELKVLFDKIKGDTEQFFERSKKLSDTGAHEAQELIEAVKVNWQSVVKGFSSSGGIAGLFSQIKASPKRMTKKATVKKKKSASLVAGSKKKTVRKHK